MRKLNKIILNLFIVMYSVLVVSYVGGYLMSSKTLFDTINCLANQALFIASIVIICVSYKKDPDGDKFRYVAMIVNCITYLPIVTLSGTSEAYIVGICNACIYLLYLDVKIVFIYSTWICIVTIFNAIVMTLGIMNFDYGNAEIADIKSSFTQILSAIVFDIILTFSTKIAKKHNDEKLEIISNSKDKIENMMNNTVNAVMNVNDDIRKGNEHIAELEINTDNYVRIFERIMDGNISNTESVQVQADMTYKIAGLIDNVVKESNAAKETTEISLDSLYDSKNSLKDLKYTSNTLVKVNDEVMNSMNKVVENMRNVKKITEMISEISEETNLLSLNASIESAKAGKYGKGFTVVANAIRRLSIQSTELTVDIENIITTLENETLNTKNLLDKTSQSIQEESERLDVAMDKFSGMQYDMNNLKMDMNSILSSTDELVKYNNEVIGHIDNLAAEAQEVTASIQEAYSMSEINRIQTCETKDIFKDVENEVAKLI